MSLLLVLCVCESCWSLLLVLCVCESCLSLLLVLCVCESCWSLLLVLCVCESCWSLLLVLCVCVCVCVCVCAWCVGGGRVCSHLLCEIVCLVVIKSPSPFSDSVATGNTWSGVAKSFLDQFFGPLYWFPPATDQVSQLSQKVNELS